MNILNCHDIPAVCASHIMQDKEHDMENLESLYADSLLSEPGQDI